jgi:hypothetical protein
LTGSKDFHNRWVFVIAFALVFYVNGAGFIESFVNYPSWPLVGQADFVTYHRFISPRILAFLVAPALLCTVFTILMLWARPATIPRWTVWAAIALHAVVWISTATIQVPIQIQLSEHGISPGLVERLIGTNFWLRRIPMAIIAGLFVWMAARSLQDDGDTRFGSSADSSQ